MAVDMTTKERNQDGIVIIEIEGKICDKDGADELYERLKDLLADGVRRVLLNLGSVTYIDSAGLGTFIGAQTRFKRAEGQFKICNATKRIQDLFAITKLVTVLDSHHESEQDAILDCKGKITIGDGSSVLREAVRRKLDEGRKRLALNLEEVSYVDNSGIGEFVSSYTTVAYNGGVLVLLNVSKKIKDILTITKLLTVLESFDNEAAAVARLSQ